jgi:hypothetical protein
MMFAGLVGWGGVIIVLCIGVVLIGEAVAEVYRDM